MKYVIKVKDTGMFIPFQKAKGEWNIFVRHAIDPIMRDKYNVPPITREEKSPYHLNLTQSLVNRTNNFSMYYAFIYDQKEHATNYIDYLGKKLMGRYMTEDNLSYIFEVHEYHKLDLGNIPLIKKEKTPKYQWSPIKGNKLGFTNTYCMNCGIYIPEGVQAMVVGTWGNTFICPMCIKEFSNISLESWEKLDKTDREMLENERLINRIVGE